jgi:hypothetical protein
MRGMGRTARLLLPWLACAALLSSCRSVPDTLVALPPTSSLLAVDVEFPFPMNRDPSLVQAFFVKAPLRDGMDELPELIPATFVKGSRAYLLDPEPGAYGLVAVSAEFAPPWNLDPIAGVTDTVWSGTSSDAMIFPAELIERTLTTVAAGEVAFIGLLRVRRGDHISAHAVPRDDLQRRIAERIRPGVTSESGISAWLMRARVVDLENTTLSGDAADRSAFLAAALADLGASPWAAVIARAAGAGETRVARPGAPAPAIESPADLTVRADADRAALSPAPTWKAVAPKSHPTVAAPQASAADVEAAAAHASAAVPAPEPLPLAPRPQPFPGVPPDSPFAKIERGMQHDEVEKILGSPDRRIDYVTSKAWIPFYDGPDANLRDWIYTGRGRVVFSLHRGSLTVIDVAYDPDQRR